MESYSQMMQFGYNIIENHFQEASFFIVTFQIQQFNTPHMNQLSVGMSVTWWAITSLICLIFIRNPCGQTEMEVFFSISMILEIVFAASSPDFHGKKRISQSTGSIKMTKIISKNEWCWDQPTGHFVCLFRSKFSMSQELVAGGARQLFLHMPAGLAQMRLPGHLCESGALGLRGYSHGSPISCCY